MRTVPSRYSLPEKTVTAKAKRAKLAHISPPIKGMAESAQTGEADAKFAGIIVNMYVEDDRLTTRAGHRRIAVCAGGKPVDHIIPYYGEPQRGLAATNNTFCDVETGAVLKSGFTNNDWHWTQYSDLGDVERVVMVNGADGVWSWDGGNIANSAAVTVTKIAKNTFVGPPADTDGVVTVTSTAGMLNGDTVIISGADANHAAANGPHRINKVNTYATNSFTLMGVNSSGWGADQTTGTMTSVKQGSFVEEALIVPAGSSWINPKDFSCVVTHQNRLWFADEENLALFYLPISQRYGDIKVLPLNAIFKKGGTVRALATWTVDGGDGMDDKLVIFTTKGECAIYSGVDPASDFSLVGVFAFEPPMSKWSTLKYGGELYCLIPTGLTPMSTVLRSGREGKEAADQNVVSFFLKNATSFQSNYGWELFLNPQTGRMMCNVPRGGGVYTQMVRSMAKPVWSELRNIPARCWGWLAPYSYFGDDLGNIYQMHPIHQSDQHVVGGTLTTMAITIDVQTAWSQYKTPANKQFKMVLPYIISDGFPKPAIDVKVDFDDTPPINVPDITDSDASQATWDVATWSLPNGAPAQPALPNSLRDPQPATPAVGPIAGDAWVSGKRRWNNWTGVGGIGRVGAVRMTANIINCSFECLGWGLLYEEGSVFG